MQNHPHPLPLLEINWTGKVEANLFILQLCIAKPIMYYSFRGLLEFVYAVVAVVSPVLASQSTSSMSEYMSLPPVLA